MIQRHDLYGQAFHITVLPLWYFLLLSALAQHCKVPSGSVCLLRSARLCFSTRSFCALLHICGEEIQRCICVCARDHTEEAGQPNVLTHHTQKNGAAPASPPLFLKNTVSLTSKHTGHMIYFCFAKCFLLDSGKYSADATALHLAAAASPAFALAAPLVLLWAPAASILR